MTREEAITALGDRNNLLWGMSKEEQKYYSEALDMAISALKGFEGMTYREVARAVFPNAPVISNNLTRTVRVLFSDEVWNSPYKGGE